MSASQFSLSTLPPARHAPRGHFLPKPMRRWLRLTALVLWWAMSFQLLRHYRWWRQARLAPTAVVADDATNLLRLLVPVDPARIRIPVHAAPEISILISSYGKVDFTLRCLAAIAEHPSAASIEVIVVEDASGDPDVEKLATIPDIRLIRLPTNLGYLHSVNAAARLAIGEFLLLLNNDTQVQAGWLDPMVELFRSDATVGAVGAKLIYPDGRLQEAGGIIWSDGTGWNVGRLDRPDRPEHDFLREVDYCSAACLLVRRAEFLEMGGFDPRYAPAYYEDTDLAFRLRARGRRVIYQPRSRVVHFEGVSHGTDIAAGGKAHQATNRLLFVDRWRTVLTQHHFRPGEQAMRARERGRPIVLVVDHYVPEPDRDAGSRNILSLILALQQAGMAVKFAAQNSRAELGYARDLAAMGVEVLVPAPVAWGGDGHAAWLAEHGGALDLVLLSRPDVARKYLPLLRQHTGAAIVYYGHDLHFARLRRQAELLADRAAHRQSALMERQERNIWRASDLVLYPSAEEAATVVRLEPGVVARAVTPFSFAGFPAARAPVPGFDILFVAGFAHPPNEDAAIWLANEILPAVRARVPQARLRIVGSNPTASVRALEGQGISVAANVSAVQLADEYIRARVAVVPLRFGAGVKLKVVEALQAGLPVVTTPVGAQGLPALAEFVPVETDATCIAAAICILLTDDTLWRARSEAQIAYARDRFSQDAVRRSLIDALASLPGSAMTEEPLAMAAAE